MYNHVGARAISDAIPVSIPTLAAWKKLQDLVDGITHGRTNAVLVNLKQTSFSPKLFVRPQMAGNRNFN